MRSPNPQSNQLSQLSSAYHKHEAEKKRAYGQRIREVEHGSFSTLGLFFNYEGKQTSATNRSPLLYPSKGTHTTHT